MNEDGTITAPEAPEGEQQETTTEAEVLEILGKSPAAPAEESEENEEVAEEETEESETPESPENPEAPATDVEDAQEVETPEAPSETPTFTVEIEDANGKKFTVSPDDNLEDVLAEFEPKNNGQVLQLMRTLDKLGNEKAAHEASQAEEAEAAARAEQVTGIQAGWDDEIKRLQGEKRLPLDAKIEDRKTAVFKFMAEENEKRQTENRPLLQSFEDALDKLELKESKDAQVAEARREKEDNKKRGGLVGGSSAPATSSAPVYKSGMARNSNEALRAMGLL